MKLASGFAPVSKMLEVCLNVGIGTDGPASNNDLDMFEEVRLAAFIAKAVSNDSTSLPAAQALSMATRLGARAMHIGDITGTLEAGKRADLILVDIAPLHNSPRFERDANNAYSQIVYASKSTDVSDVMVNGKWLMRDHKLLTLNEADLLQQAASYAKRIDTFLMAREQSVLSKLIALGGSIEAESFEVQIKVRANDPLAIQAALQSEQVEIIYQKHYRQFDNYFTFETATQGRLRYREDDFIDEKGKVINVRARLTLIGQNREDDFEGDVLLSRSRYLAPASQTLRFYREYFKPSSEKVIEKDRLRWQVRYQGEEFYINLDKVERPDLGFFLEIKSRTWSRKDAERKAQLAAELVTFLGASGGQLITSDYFGMIS
jgi:5-methylthioadenosine/S-adenosylhomocysteine deaminase